MLQSRDNIEAPLPCYHRTNPKIQRVDDDFGDKLRRRATGTARPGEYASELVYGLFRIEPEKKGHSTDAAAVARDPREIVSALSVTMVLLFPGLFQVGRRAGSRQRLFDGLGSKLSTG
jgi:hypothetical protein